MMLQGVILHKTDTCLTYVLRRLGKCDLIETITYDNIHDYFDLLPFTKKRKLEIGDILLWQRDSTMVDMPWEIEKSGKIIWHRKIIGSHVAIYEGDNMISDTTRFLTPPHPNLRLRKLEQLYKIPDYVLKLNQENIVM
jgi:hypothetical protein